MWAAVSLAALAGAVRISSATLSRTGRLATGVTLILLAALHLALRPGEDAMALLANAVLLATGLLLIATVFGPRLLARKAA